jgi:amylosucrase
MPIQDTISYKTAHSLERLLPRLRPLFKNESEWTTFESRLRQHFPTLFPLLLGLYGSQYDFFYHLETILTTAAQYFLDRPAALKQLDESRSPTWFQSEQMMGGVCYVDLYAENLTGIQNRIPYFKELGLTYLHLMPLFTSPEGNNDGGYAVSSFREVDPKLTKYPHDPDRSMDELATVAADLRANGISLCVDFVFNHTSNEHEWALKAKAGDIEHQAFYWMYDDRTIPDQFEFDSRGYRQLREIFPEQAPGCFTYLSDIEKWVWTTFNTFQWDLNYGNPALFNAMLGEMLNLANHGVEVLRMDAVAFIWKQMGTSCENLPQAQDLIAAYNLLVRISAPSMIFKSEAIVHPRDVAKYVGRECQISYNPTFMVLLWESLATRNVRLLRLSMQKWFQLPVGTAWVNYVRSHDDIGWSFADEDAAELWINGFDHRRFLNQFYTGRFEGSDAVGVPFNYNPQTQDMRISGTAASLAGLEKAIQEKDDAKLSLAIGRILLIESLALAAGGIPLLYLGDEFGMLNDYSYHKHPAKSIDSRWVHRPAFDPDAFAQRTDPTTIAGRIFDPLRRMIHLRKINPVFAADGKATWSDCGNDHVLLLERVHAGNWLLILANFADTPQTIQRRDLPAHDPRHPYTDLLTGDTYPLEHSVTLPPYGTLWLSYE